MNTITENSTAPRRTFWPRLRPPRRHVFHLENVLGTSLELQVVAASDAVARHAESAALDEIDRLSAILSGWSGASELARWQMTHECDAVVSPELADVLQQAEAWRVRTHGAFNPAAQAVIARLEAGESVDDLYLPLSQPLWRIDRERSTARRLTSLPISLDAIAKGYIVSHAAARAFAVDGVDDVLLNIGGDVQHVGPGEVRVGVTSPFATADNAEPMATVRLAGRAIATSGGYRRGFVANGVRCSHIVDPREGRPADMIVSASVIADDCATADALSTAFSVLTPLESLNLANALGGVACLLVRVDGETIANQTWRAAELNTLNPRGPTT